MNDVVIPLGSGSKWQDNELRYCLRSLEMHLKNYRNVFLVGLRPPFVSDAVVHIPNYPGHTNPARNIMEHLSAACRDERVSEDFLYINDDYIFTAPVDATDYPNFYKCTLPETARMNKSYYRKHVVNTATVLLEKGFPVLNFDTHYPIIFNKQKLLAVIHSYDWNRLYGYVLKSLYCNSLGIEGTHRLDCKAIYGQKREGWIEYIKDKEVFSIDDSCITPEFGRWMEEMYPALSRFEK